MKPSADRLALLRALRCHLESQIIGQGQVIPRIADALCDGELGLTDPRRPKGSFLFLGPTGVGKTELTLCFTRYLSGEDHLVRLDMSEYQNQESVGILLGKSGSDRGLLAKRLSPLPSGTLLLDEMEKAHPRVLDLLLQMLDAARITMADGETISLANFHVVCTSNIAAQAILDLKQSVRSTLVRFVEAQAQAQLRPEIFARFSLVAVFDKLGYQDQVRIARHLLERELDHLRTNLGAKLEYEDSILPFLVGEGFHPRLGARPLRNSIERLVRGVVREELLAGRLAEGTLALRTRGSGSPELYLERRL